MHRLQAPGHQRMPPGQSPGLHQSADKRRYRAASQFAHHLWRQRQTVRHFFVALCVIRTAALADIKQLARQPRQIDFIGVFIFKLQHAAAPTAVAQLLPLAMGHFIEAFALPIGAASSSLAPSLVLLFCMPTRIAGAIHDKDGFSGQFPIWQPFL